MRTYSPDLPLFSIHIPKMGGTSFTSVLEQWFNKTNLLNLTHHPKVRTLLRQTHTEHLSQRLFKCGLWYHYKNHKTNKLPQKTIFNQKYGLLTRENIPECIHGHFSFQDDGMSLLEIYPFADQFITVLRDPLESQISLYYYQKKLLKKDGFIAWQGNRLYELPYSNIDEWVVNHPFFMLTFLPFSLTTENFKMVLQQKFIHICVVENYQRSVDLLADKLGFKTVEIPFLNVTSTTAPKEILSQNAIDIFRTKHRLEYLIYEFALNLNK